MMTYKPLTELSVEEWDRVQGVNLRGAFLCAKFTMPYMEGGAIVNVSSIHAHETTPNVIPYSTSKAGLEALTRGLSRECAPGICVSTQSHQALSIRRCFGTIRT